MQDQWWAVRRRLLDKIGIQPGVGLLFTARSRRRFVIAAVASLLVALLEVLAVATVLPLMQLLTGADHRKGVLGILWRLLGEPSLTVLAGVLGLIIFGAFLIKGILSLWTAWWLSGVMQEEQVETSRRLLDYYLRAPYDQVMGRPVAELVSTANDYVATTYGSVYMSTVSLLSDGLSLVAVVVLLVLASPVPAVVVIAYFLTASMLFRRFTSPRAVAAGNEMTVATQRIFRSAVDALASGKENRVMDARHSFVDHYTEARSSFAYSLRWTSFLTALPKYVMEILFVLGVAVMTAAVYATNSGPEAIGLISLFAAAGFRILPTVVRIMGSYTSIETGQAAVRAVVRDVRRVNDTPIEAPDPLDRLPLERAIVVDNVSYRYPESHEVVLDHVSLTIPKGTSTALVGASGAGKTTLADILLGLFIPTDGKVLVDGRDIGEHVTSWRKLLAYVPQDVYLFAGTLRENIAYTLDSKGVDDEKVWAALAKADLAKHVRKLDHGLDTLCGDRGARFSGGQRQRIGLARALYRDPEVLMLDEATSALDNRTERRITDAIDALRGSMTIIVIAHRLSTVRRCEQIVHLDEGKVVGKGTFDELVAADGEFARLVELGKL